MAHPDDASDPEHAKSEANLAALMARDARLAKYAAIKEQQVAKIQKDAAAKENPLGAALAAPAVEEEVIASPKIPLSEKLVTGKNANYTTIAAFVLIVIALGFVGNALRPIFFPAGIKLHSATAPAKPKATTVPAPTAQKPAAAVAANVSAKAPVASHGSVPASKSANATSPLPSPAVSEGPHSVDVPQPAVRSPKVVDVTPADADSADNAPAQTKHRKAAEPDAAGNAPARILEQPQPTYPAWAKSLDLDGVVKLDAVIDEKGNLAQTKVLSGPRQLQHAAEQAVGLWEFAPAQSAGKPVSSHMTLTVEFQR
jgi:TonB family protein